MHLLITLKDQSAALARACRALLITLPVLGHAAEPSAAPLRAPLDAERHAIRLVGRPERQLALGGIAARWRARTPGLLPGTYAQLHDSIREVAFMAALQIIDGDPRRPQVIDISAPPQRWFGTAVPGGRWGINNPDTLYFTIPVEPGSRYVITGQRHAKGPTDANYTVQTGAEWGAVDNLARPDLRVAADGSYRITVDGRCSSGQLHAPARLDLRGPAPPVSGEVST